MCISLEALCLEIQITVCGIQASGRSKRVEGNYEVLPHSKPWMGLMVNKKYGPFCSAFLINLKPGENHSDMALTAAHCLPIPKRWKPAVS
uniref:Uncharacterized protein n=1 Tax=Romanomermis culicivorax TaxID=13658 RepID=A0A915K873_ROMCU